MRVPIEEVRRLMTAVCAGAGLSEVESGLVVDHYLDGELRGRTSHGVAKFCFESQFFGTRAGKPFVVEDFGAVAVVDGAREVGPLSVGFAVDVVVEKARRFGIGLVGMNNTQRHGALGYWTRRIAEQGQLGVVMNTSTADSTVVGATRAFLGVNPLSFAFPAEGGPVVADLSTTVAPMGRLWEARRGNGGLEDGQFVDAGGGFTTNPDEATAAVIFGGHKGFALSLLVQLLTGSVFGFPMGERVESLLDTGYAFLAVDPSFGGGRRTFVDENSALVRALTSVPMRDGGTLRLFGRESDAVRAAALAEGRIRLGAGVLERLRSSARRS
ncbi:Ldh family oxidoreductase [Actinosynnema sp. NPDC020468]|uniref:Ldh family oxidoreductase n=1 Tax=Actinosynnema sp. NPDC020468 TaxID=3154488 RepID=UPI0033C16712